MTYDEMESALAEANRWINSEDDEDNSMSGAIEALVPCVDALEQCMALLATALVPVPVGEPCRWKYITDDQMVVFNEEIFIPVPESYDAINIDGNYRENIPDTAIVQLVRLVPAMEVINDADNH